MDFNEGQLLALLQLKPDQPANFDTQKITRESEVVPNLLDEFLHVADTKVLKQPFSLKKYKNLIPKRLPRKTRKQKTIKLVKENKLIFQYSDPASPSPSVDSAIDLSADLNSNFSNNTISNCSLSSGTWISDTNFEFDRESICDSDFTDNNSVFSLETSHQWLSHHLKDNSKTKMKEDRNQYLKELDNIICISAKKFKNTPCSLSDILLTDISFQIPIVVENNAAKDDKNCKGNFADTFLNNTCDNKTNIDVIKGGSQLNYSHDNNNIFSPDNDSNGISNKQDTATVTEEINENKTPQTSTSVEVLKEPIQYTAIKSSRFVVEDDFEIPPGLLKLLDVRSSSSNINGNPKISNDKIKTSDNNNNNNNKNDLEIISGYNRQNDKRPSNSFCVGLLHMLSSGILEKSKNGGL